jgi:DNA replication protein DnaC
VVHELTETRDDKALRRLQRQLTSYKLPVIDELGYVPLSQTGAELLFEVFSQRYERGSTIVTRSSLCAQQARFAERTGQKIVVQRQLADLGVQHLQIHRRRCLSRSAAEQPGRPVKHLSLPCRDLVGVNILLLRQLR